MAPPLVSFVIPVFNSERDIRRCLQSIQQLRIVDESYEVVILDNGSTDQTHDIMRSLGFDFQVVPRITVSALRNRGAACARGEYLAFVDSDVEIATEWLCNGLQVFADTRVVACGCFPGVPSQATWVQRTWDLHQRGRYALVAPQPTAWLSSMNLLVRRDAFLAVGGFNETLKTAEDVDLSYRLARQGTLLCNPAMEAVHWGEAHSLKKFWQKEVWRGLGNLKGIQSHGWRWDEVPSLGYPLYVGGLIALLIVGLAIDLWRGQFLVAPVCFALLVLPALVLAANTVRLARHPTALFQLFLLYFVYGLARAYSIVKA